MNKKDQDAIAKLYSESTGYTGETNDNYDFHKDPDHTELIGEYNSITQELEKLTRQYKHIESQIRQAREIQNELRERIRQNDPSFDNY